jgi:hypothetical protein
MKSTILALIIFCFFTANSQELNYCDYFNLEVKETGKGRKKSNAAWPVVLKSKKDRFYVFLINHSERFEYIITKHTIKFGEIAKYYPDTTKIRSEFCNQLINTKEIQNYFPVLTPNYLVNWDSFQDTFTVSELMLAASRFFYCDAINMKDTSIQSHLCIAINGQAEFKSERDLTLLEAFSIEALLKVYMLNPQFITEFLEYKDKIAVENRSEFKDFDSYLLTIRRLCYLKMQENEDLKIMLLAYYEKNRNNLNFLIQ